MEASGPTGPEEQRAQDVETEVEAAAAVGDVIPERGAAAYFAEFIGTFGLVFFITMAASEILRPPLSPAEIAQGASPPFIDLTVIGLVHVFALFLLIQTLAVVSGAHFNPAVTSAMAAIRQIRPIDAGIYVVLQLAGGVLGALVTKLILKADNVPNAKAVHWGAPSFGDNLGGSVGLAMLVEGIGTFFLVWAIIGVAVHPNAFREWAGLVIGGALGLAFLVGGLLTGGSFNPARAFGPALASGTFDPNGWKWILAYVLAPIVGALLSAFIYMQMFVLPGKKGPFGMAPVG